jgi:hypothetical protein
MSAGIPVRCEPWLGGTSLLWAFGQFLVRAALPYPMMACFRVPALVNIPANRVQSVRPTSAPGLPGHIRAGTAPVNIHASFGRCGPALRTARPALRSAAVLSPIGHALAVEAQAHRGSIGRLCVPTPQCGFLPPARAVRLCSAAVLAPHAIL